MLSLARITAMTRVSSLVAFFRNIPTCLMDLKSRRARLDKGGMRKIEDCIEICRSRQLGRESRASVLRGGKQARTVVSLPAVSFMRCSNQNLACALDID